MADVTYMAGRDDFVPATSRTAWGAIFGGTFAFLAVWATFGTLGLAIFASNANPNAAKPLSGMPVGEGFWIAILSIIALYVGGRVTAALAGIRTRTDGVMHGLIMFGLSVFSAILIAALIAGSTTVTTTAASLTAHSPYLLSEIAGSGYILFVSLILGGCAAMLGGTHGLPRATRVAATEVPEVRRIA